MTFKVLTLVTALCISSISAFAQNPSKKMNNKASIKTVIETFVKAGTERNIALYEGILHDDFRVIANRYPAPDKTSIISADTYKDLITKKVIGGTQYKIDFKDISISDHSATVEVELKSDKGGQVITFLLIQNNEAKWLIITDMACLLYTSDAADD